MNQLYSDRNKWIIYMEPKKDKDNLIWGWKSSEKLASTVFFAKYKMIFPNVTPDQIF